MHLYWEKNKKNSDYVGIRIELKKLCDICRVEYYVAVKSDVRNCFMAEENVLNLILMSEMSKNKNIKGWKKYGQILIANWI